MKRIALLLAIVVAGGLIFLLILPPREGGRRDSSPPIAPVDRDEGDGVEADLPSGVEAKEATEPDSVGSTPEGLLSGSPEITGSVANPPSKRTDGRVLSVLYGLLTDVDGLPLEGRDAGVTLRQNEGHDLYTRTRDGRYAFAGIPPGTWRLSWWADGFESGKHQVKITVEGGVLRRDLILQRELAIPVRFLTPEGEPLGTIVRENTLHFFSALTAVATVEDPGERLPPTDRDRYEQFGVGEYESRDSQRHPEFAGQTSDFVGRLTLLRPPPLFVSAVLRSEVLQTKRIEEMPAELTFTIPVEEALAALCGLRAVLHDSESGTPVESAWVSAGCPSGRASLWQIQEQGLLRAEGLLPGPCRLTIRADGYGTIERRLTLEPGQTEDLGIVVLSPAVHVSGRLVDSSGEPVSAHLHSSPFVPGEPRATLFDSQWSMLEAKEDGRFLVPGLAAGRLLLRIAEDRRFPGGMREPEWSAAPILVDTTGGSVDDLEIVVYPTIPVTFRATEAREDSVGFYVLTPDGLPYRFSRIYGTTPCVLRLAPGSYRILLGRGEEIGETTPLEVGTEPLEITLGE